MIRFIYVVVALFLTIPALAQQRSAKRGIGWDEKTRAISEQHVSLMSPGVSWLYNWGISPRNAVANLGPQGEMEFIPMCWNAGFNEEELRAWLTANPGARYLLGFNEPNFSAQANMTPAQAAAAWPRVEKIAADFGLKLVAPALNFTAERVGGRTWNPYEWLDEFLRLYPEAHFDCLALHCYMNWYSANTWFATEYFYEDLYNPEKKDVYGRYPNIVKYLDSYKAVNGHFPHMMLTEFCSWENDGTVTGVDFQIDQMTQKVQKLEQSDLVEGYAWFMANGRATEYPYFSIFETNSNDSPLSALGTVYTHMSSFDKSKYYAPGEQIAAKDYTDASTDDQQVRLRPNTESPSTLPLQVEMKAGAWAQYQIDIPEEGKYTVTMHISSKADNSVFMYVDGKKQSSGKMESTNNAWIDRDLNVSIPAGKHSIMLYNAGVEPFLINSLQFHISATGISAISQETSGHISGTYTPGGINVSDKNLEKGIYIVVMKSGQVKKTFIK